MANRKLESRGLWTQEKGNNSKVEVVQLANRTGSLIMKRAFDIKSSVKEPDKDCYATEDNGLCSCMRYSRDGKLIRMRDT